MICPKCNEKVASDVKICPKCGADIDKLLKKEMFWFVFVCLLGMGGFVFLLNDVDVDGTNLFCCITLVIFAIIIMVLSQKIKNLVLKVARWLLDFATTLDVLSGILILLAGIPISMNSYGNVPYWWFIVGAFVYSLIMLVKDYVLYLLVDIRDSLKILSDKAKQDISEKQENNE